LPVLGTPVYSACIRQCWSCFPLCNDGNDDGNGNGDGDDDDHENNNKALLFLTAWAYVQYRTVLVLKCGAQRTAYNLWGTRTSPLPFFGNALQMKMK
jgi:hypothetical protein